MAQACFEQILWANSAYFVHLNENVKSEEPRWWVVDRLKVKIKIQQSFGECQLQLILANGKQFLDFQDLQLWKVKKLTSDTAKEMGWPQTFQFGSLEF